MNPEDYFKLKNEIATNQCYQEHTSGNDQIIADLLNSITVDTIKETQISQSDFLLAITPAMIKLAEQPDALQAKWDRILNIITKLKTINLNDPQIKAILTNLTTDQLETQEEIDKIGQKPASRAEVLFGAGTTITNDDISFVLRGTR